jgi:hypothetical protein
MLVLNALFDHIQQISSRVEIIGSLVQRADMYPAGLIGSRALGLVGALMGKPEQRG